MKFKTDNTHLAYCTNIHPAETWAETFHALKTYTLSVRDRIGAPEFAIGLRLSALAANEILQDNHLAIFKKWLEKEHCYVFTINGFPYGSFHGTRVKEKVYQPDWSNKKRLDYTKKLFTIIAQLVPGDMDGSVSTLPGSFKEFCAEEPAIFKNLEICAQHIEKLSNQYNRNLHLGLEPEPLGHFANTKETLAFFDRFLPATKNPSLIRQRIGINYDTCHFALEFEDCHTSLNALRAAGILISKIHLSSALAFDPTDEKALEILRRFDEPTYLHQVITRTSGGTLTRYKDIPGFLRENQIADEARCHFHIPLYAMPESPLSSTQGHALAALDYLKIHPSFCTHFEIETYTWQVLPDSLQIPVEEQIAQEYHWVETQI